MSTTPAAIPIFLARLVDDAAIFPPGNADLRSALEAHREHQRAPYANLVGPFVVSDVRIPALIALRETAEPGRSEPAEPLPVTVVVTGGAGAIEGAVRWVTGTDQLALRSLEFALRDEEDLVHNARRVTTAIDQLLADGHLGDDVDLYVEPPRLLDGSAPSYPWLGALDEVAAGDYRLKFRTGGTRADAFPSSAELATCIESALDRELPFKCTAGLHRASRHRDDATGFEHHGFLNVLLATRAGLDGESPADLLEESGPEALTGRLDAVGPDALASTRRWFTSFGSCSVLEPLEDLHDLGLLPDLPDLPEERS